MPISAESLAASSTERLRPRGRPVNDLALGRWFLRDSSDLTLAAFDEVCVNTPDSNIGFPQQSLCQEGSLERG